MQEALVLLGSHLLSQGHDFLPVVLHMGEGCSFHTDYSQADVALCFLLVSPSLWQPHQWAELHIWGNVKVCPLIRKHLLTPAIQARGRGHVDY